MSAFFGPSRKKLQKYAKQSSENHQKSIKKHQKAPLIFDCFSVTVFFRFLSKNGPQGGAGGLQKSDKK